MFISKFSRPGARAAFKGSLSKAPPIIRSYKSYYPIIQNDYLKPSSCKLFSTTATENSLGENEETKKASRKMSKMRALWQASLTATKRALTWNIEDMIPPSERFIYNFNSKEELKKWHLYSDSEYGGLSSAALEITDTGKEHSGTGVFSGNLSLDVTEGTKWNISRSGFCGMRSKKFDGFIDLDPYDTIALKLKGDGRSYISTIYTENWVNSPGQMEDNSWQAFVAVPRDDWVIAKIPLAHYLPTWRGNVIEADIEMNPSRVVGMSLSVNAEGGVPGAQTGPGDFRLEIEWIKALRTQ